jgi:hypothetical protein
MGPGHTTTALPVGNTRLRVRAYSRYHPWVELVPTSSWRHTAVATRRPDHIARMSDVGSRFGRGVPLGTSTSATSRESRMSAYGPQAAACHQATPPWAHHSRPDVGARYRPRRAIGHAALATSLEGRMWAYSTRPRRATRQHRLRHIARRPDVGIRQHAPACHQARRFGRIARRPDVDLRLRPRRAIRQRRLSHTARRPAVSCTALNGGVPPGNAASAASPEGRTCAYGTGPRRATRRRRLGHVGRRLDVGLHNPAAVCHRATPLRLHPPCRVCRGRGIPDRPRVWSHWAGENFAVFGGSNRALASGSYSK